MPDYSKFKTNAELARSRYIVRNGLVVATRDQITILKVARDDIAECINVGGQQFICNAISHAVEKLYDECPFSFDWYNLGEFLKALINARMDGELGMKGYIKHAMQASLGGNRQDYFEHALDHCMNARLAWLDRIIEMEAI